MDLTNKNFGQYHIVRKLGRGGMGEVYEAEHSTLQRRYALKFMFVPEDPTNRQKSEMRFQREAKVMAELEHAHIVRVDDFGESEGRYWLRMELIRGVEPKVVTLGDYVTKKGGKLEPGEFGLILEQILEGLAHAHSKGVVHRDLKPGNILLEKGKDSAGNVQVKISDFGLARIVGEDLIHDRVQSRGANESIANDVTVLGDRPKKDTNERAMLGTWEYMSPEQKRSEEADERSDVYAVGLMCYRLLTGEEELGREAISELVPGVERSWDAFVDKAIEKKAENRYANGGEMLAEFTRVLSPSSASRDDKATIKPAKIEQTKKPLVSPTTAPIETHKYIKIVKISLAVTVLVGLGFYGIRRLTPAGQSITVIQTQTVTVPPTVTPTQPTPAPQLETATDSFSNDAHQVNNEARSGPSWSAVKAYVDLIHKHPKHEAESLAFLSNYVSSVAPSLSVSPADFHDCSSELAAIAGHQVTVLRLMVSNVRQSTDPADLTYWSNRLQQAIQNLFDAIQSKATANDPNAAFSSLQSFLSEYPEASEMVASFGSDLYFKYYEGGGSLGAVDLNKYHDLIEKFADHGCIPANIQIADSVRSQNPAEAYNRYQKAQLQGDLSAWHMMVVILLDRSTPLARITENKRDNQAAQLLLSAKFKISTEQFRDQPDRSKLAAASLLFVLGKAYWFGNLKNDGIPQDQDKAVQVLSQAQEMGSEGACYFLGAYYCGLDGNESAAHELNISKGLDYLHTGSLSKTDAVVRKNCKLALAALSKMPRSELAPFKAQITRLLDEAPAE